MKPTLLENLVGNVDLFCKKQNVEEVPAFSIVLGTHRHAEVIEHFKVTVLYQKLPIVLLPQWKVNWSNLLVSMHVSLCLTSVSTFFQVLMKIKANLVKSGPSVDEQFCTVSLNHFGANVSRSHLTADVSNSLGTIPFLSAYSICLTHLSRGRLSSENLT